VLGPHAVYTVSTDSLRWTAEYAQQHDLRVHIHLSETNKEVEDCQARHGLRPVEYLHSLGLLGPHLSLAHAIWLSEKEMELLAAHKVGVVHCPVSNMKLASGRFDLAGMRRHGVPVPLGTDGCASNNNLDMFDEMKAASLSAKITSMDPSLFPAQEVLDAATVVGARMYGLESGRIAVGALADCMLVDLNRPCMTPHHHLVSNLVYSANGGCVDTVICDGRILMRKGVVDGEEEILAHARETAVRLAGAARSGERVCS
jgi:5-methylthioadenosine/S-adenosylhomocysteine deaminase